MKTKLLFPGADLMGCMWYKLFESPIYFSRSAPDIFLTLTDSFISKNFCDLILIFENLREYFHFYVNL